jgi:hypothetical protein
VIGPSLRPLRDSTEQLKEKEIHVLTGFETAMPVSEWQQTHALDRAATGIGLVKL